MNIRHFTDFFKPKGFVQVLLFHKIYPSKSDIILEHGDPLEGICKSEFEEIIRYFHERNYLFINEQDIILKKLNPRRRHLFITFDDGYFNNTLILDILEKYNAKATFYIATDFIENGKQYWWDIHYRERHKQCKSEAFIREERLQFYTMTGEQQYEFLEQTFGSDALYYSTELSRVMTKAELQNFARHPLVSLGNHTHQHINMAAFEREYLMHSLQKSQDFLENTTQKPVESISYPFGEYNETALSCVAEFGLKLGVSVDCGKNKCSEIYKNNQILKLRRSIPNGYFPIRNQCNKIENADEIF